MRPFAAEWAGTELSPQDSDIQVGDRRYRAVFADGEAFVREKGPDGEKPYRIEYALGGKNVYYFLTPMERGRLQVLPVAYDVHEKTLVRHDRQHGSPRGPSRRRKT